MSEVFEVKLRKIGNSMGVIIPAKIIEELHVEKGDFVSVCIPKSDIRKRNSRLSEIAGIDSGKAGFIREKEDRY